MKFFRYRRRREHASGITKTVLMKDRAMRQNPQRRNECQRSGKPAREVEARAVKEYANKYEAWARAQKCWREEVMELAAVTRSICPAGCSDVCKD